MLYLDYGRQGGDWVPNRYGGRENLEDDRISWRHLNESVYRDYPDVQTIAEESTAWPMVSRPAYVGGPGLRPQVEHGWHAHDHAHLTLARDPLVPPPPPNEITLQHLVRIQRKLRAAASRMTKVVYGKRSLLVQDARR